MNNSDVGISLRPVEIGGFQLSISDKPFYIIIKFEGRECDYLYYWSERPKTQGKYEKELANALQDFIYAAKVGIGGKDAYVSEHGEGVPNAEIDAAWAEYQEVARDFERLVGASPDNFKLFHANI